MTRETTGPTRAVLYPLTAGGFPPTADLRGRPDRAGQRGLVLQNTVDNLAPSPSVSRRDA